MPGPTLRCRNLVLWVGSQVALCTMSGGAPAFAQATASPPFAAWIADEGERVRREQVGSLSSPRALRLEALREEVVAFQVIVSGTGEPVRVPVAFSGFRRSDGSGSPLRVDAWVEHYLEVSTRSRNSRRPRESLGWSAAARPDDGEMLGGIPDALIPVPLAERSGAYPLLVTNHQSRAMWFDVAVPEDAPAGRYSASVKVGSDPAPLDIEIDVLDAILPYRAVSFLLYYDPAELTGRLGAGSRAEQQLWQLLHQHHVDALGSLSVPQDVERLRGALDGSWYRPDAGYVGPGVGVPAAAVALGAYGSLGDPTPQRVAQLSATVANLPPAVSDVFVYAIDEQCDSPRGPAWRRALSAEPWAQRVMVAHTCGWDPARQDVDLAMIPAESFDGCEAEVARRNGKRVWTYNGALPHAGTSALDAPLTNLTANGWIAASRPVDRWFIWESTFWNDDNRGGHGAVDPFVEPETFHNSDGDSQLGGGVLLYPGRQSGDFSARSLGWDGVLPSMRLKALRRGIQDAGYYALARAVHPVGADAIARSLIPLALGEVVDNRRASWSDSPAAFAQARGQLRALIPAGSRLDPNAEKAVVRQASGCRRASRTGLRAWTVWGFGFGLIVSGLAVTWWLWGRRRASA